MIVSRAPTDRLLGDVVLLTHATGRRDTADDKQRLLKIARECDGGLKRMARALSAVVTHRQAHRSSPPSEAGTRSGFTTLGRSFQKAVSTMREMTMKTSPRTKRKIPITSGGPRPNHETPP